MCHFLSLDIKSISHPSVFRNSFISAGNEIGTILLAETAIVSAPAFPAPALAHLAPLLTQPT